jgi:hypothetical protein
MIIIAVMLLIYPQKILSRCWCLATLVKYIQFPICRDGPGVVLLMEAGAGKPNGLPLVFG